MRFNQGRKDMDKWVKSGGEEAMFFELFEIFQ